MKKGTDFMAYRKINRSDLEMIRSGELGDCLRIFSLLREDWNHED